MWKGEGAYHVAFEAPVQPSPMQIAWSSAGWDGMTTAGGEHFWPNKVVKAVPTTARSSAATPKEAADMATWVMK